jgi:hypothetical protein
MIEKGGRRFHARQCTPRVQPGRAERGRVSDLAQRPAIVTGIAWTFITSAVFVLLLSLASLGAAGMAHQMLAQSPRLSVDFPWQLRIMFRMVEHFVLLTWIQIALSIVALAAGIELLRCRAWARAALEGLTWLALVATLAVGVLWLWGWMSLTPMMPEGMPLTTGLRMAGVAMVAVIVAIAVVPLVVLIRALRRPVVCAAMRG